MQLRGQLGLQFAFVEEETRSTPRLWKKPTVSSRHQQKSARCNCAHSLDHAEPIPKLKMELAKLAALFLKRGWHGAERATRGSRRLYLESNGTLSLAGEGRPAWAARRTTRPADVGDPAGLAPQPGPDNEPSGSARPWA